MALLVRVRLYPSREGVDAEVSSEILRELRLLQRVHFAYPTSSPSSMPNVSCIRTLNFDDIDYFASLHVTRIFKDDLPTIFNDFRAFHQ